MASIRRTGTGRWMARYRDAAGLQHAKTFDRKGDAERWARLMETAKESGAWLDPAGSRVLFREWAEQWERLTVAQRRDSTNARNESVIRTHLLPTFATCPLGAITPLQVRSWVAELADSGRQPATVTRVFVVFSKMMSDAVDARLIASSPCVGVRLPRIVHHEMRFLEPAEVLRLADAVDPRFRALIVVGATGGFRIGEMAGLRTQRVDLANRRVDVVEQVGEVRGRLTWGPPKTSKSRRAVVMPGDVIGVLADHMERFSANGLVFPGPEGGVLRINSWRRRFWAPAVKAAGLAPLRPHDLRHTAVALSIASGMNALEVSRRMGHDSASFTLDRYGHLFSGAEDRAADLLEGLLGPLMAVPECVPDDWTLSP